MSFLRKNWATFLFVAIVLLFASNVVRYLLAPSPEVVRPEDVRASQRVMPGADDRDPLPAGTWVGGNGIVEPRDREVKLAATVPGRIVRIAVVEGQHVEAGQVLVELEHDVEQAALDAAEADVAAAEAELLRLSHGNRVEEVESAEADAQQARVRAELSAAQFQRMQAIAQSGGVSQEELDRAQRESEGDRAAAQSIDARRRAVVSGARAEDRSAARARLAAATARRNQARANLERLSVHSPLAGEVLQLKYRVGEYVRPGDGDPVAIVGDTSQLRIRMDMDERDVGKIRVGGEAIVRAVAFGERDFHAQVVEIGRRMGRKNVRSDDPAERNDTKILEVVLVLRDGDELVVGQRVMTYVRAAEGAAPAAGAAPAQATTR